jgi:hypothetical protein
MIYLTIPILNFKKGERTVIKALMTVMADQVLPRVKTAG